MISVGLTGNMGCGKSTVARMLASLGAVVVDADRVVHELLAEGGAAVEPVLAHFPEARAADGLSVDRKALGAIVFADSERRRRLERLLHPLVIARTHQLAREAADRGATVVVTEATLLFEAARAGGPDPRTRFDRIVVVTCDPEVQMQRLAARGGADSLSAARARIALQMPQDEKAALADHVVDTSGTMADTERAVRELWSHLGAR